MRFYTSQHAFYCGVDLHARTMYVCVLDAAGEVRLHRNLPCRPDAFLQAIQPFREDLVVGVECLFCWYWLADLCAAESIPFALGHALYMKAIHGGKSKNDRIDSYKIAVLLRGGTFPMAYVYPREMRATRDLLRRRLYFVHKRAELLTHIQNTNTQYNLEPIDQRIESAANRDGLLEHFGDEDSVQMSIASDLAVLLHFVWKARRPIWWFLPLSPGSSEGEGQESSDLRNSLRQKGMRTARTLDFLVQTRKEASGDAHAYGTEQVAPRARALGAGASGC